MDIQRLYPLINLIRELSAVRNADELLDKLVVMGPWMLEADGCSCWLAGDDGLTLAAACTVSLGLTLKAAERDEKSMRMALSSRSLISEAAQTRKSLMVANIRSSRYNPEFALRFDVIYNYRTQAVIAVPLVDGHFNVLGVLQVTNPVDRAEFGEEDLWLADALGSCVTLVLSSSRQSDAAMALFRSMVTVITKAVELAEPATAAHSRRVPVLVRKFAEAMDRQSFNGFRLDDATADTLWMASTLCDAGILGVPSRILHKRTRLDGHFDRMELVRYRAKLAEAGIHLDEGLALAPVRRDEAIARLASDLHWIELINSPRAILTDEDVRRIERIAADRWRLPDGSATALLTEDEAASLSARNGTLSAEERITLNRHVEYSVGLLSEIPWPSSLQGVTEIVAGHHERLDGSGFPAGTREVPLLTRIVSLCDIWDAMTGMERIGRKRLSRDEAMVAMGEMVDRGQIDRSLWQFFVKEGFHLRTIDVPDSAIVTDDTLEAEPQ
jgi:HD-GYP domain-containing protein (c-di-GMP phosphodiesterase class II)